MSGKPSRDKGARRERELVKLLPGSMKISGLYKAGPDLVWRERPVEVKARATGWKLLYRWLQDVPILCVKADRQPWLVIMEVGELADLVEDLGGKWPD